MARGVLLLEEMKLYEMRSDSAALKSPQPQGARRREMRHETSDDEVRAGMAKSDGGTTKS